MSVRSSVRLALAGTVVAFSSPAWAHVSLTGPGYADQTQVIPFGIGHGCEGADSVRLEITIPKEVKTVIAAPSPSFGAATLNVDDAGLVTSVVWSKEQARPKDDQYYTFALRIKVPNTPFQTIYFPAKQTCKTASGEERVVDWATIVAPGETAGEDKPPAPALTILPKRFPGWNKFTVGDTAITDLKIFDDAQIVWSGDAAYSSNPATAEQIKAEDGVTELTEIAAKAEIWVKY